MFLFFSLKLYDIMIKKGTLLFWASFFLSLILCCKFSYIYEVSLGLLSFCLPVPDKNFMLIFLANFICRFVDLIFYRSVYKGCNFIPVSEIGFFWFDFIRVFNLHFSMSINIENKLAGEFYKKLSFTSYPFSMNTLIVLRNPENSILYSLKNYIEKDGDWDEEVQSHFSKTYKERLKRLRFCISLDRLQNTIVFFSVFYGNLFGLLMGIAYLSVFPLII